MKKYLIRLDDACPTMDRKKWDRVEAILDNYGIKPIVAVIPNNKDPEMMTDTPDPHFWEKVKQWQAKGWHIALHGYSHLYVTSQKGLVPMNDRSEFAGLSLDKQREKIAKGLNIFREKSIRTQTWVAPSHSFDFNTLKALEALSNICIISDGVAYYPYTKNGFFWIPQQNWKLEEKESGVWTTCFHPNTMGDKKIEAMEAFCRKNQNLFFNDIGELRKLYHTRKRDIKDRLFEKVFFLKRALYKTHHYATLRKRFKKR